MGQLTAKRKRMGGRKGCPTMLIITCVTEGRGNDDDDDIDADDDDEEVTNTNNNNNSF